MQVWSSWCDTKIDYQEKPWKTFLLLYWEGKDNFFLSISIYHIPLTHNKLLKMQGAKCGFIDWVDKDNFNGEKTEKSISLDLQK